MKISDIGSRSTDLLTLFEVWCIKDAVIDPESAASGLAFAEQVLLEKSIAEAEPAELREVVSIIAEFLPLALANEEAFAQSHERSRRLREEVLRLTPRRRGRPIEAKALGALPGGNALLNMLFPQPTLAAKGRGRPPNATPRESIRETIDIMLTSPVYRNKRTAARKAYAIARLSASGKHATGRQLAEEEKRLARLDRPVRKPHN